MAEPLSDRFNSTGRLWVCHRCQMIGEDAEAERHVELTGHRVEQQSQEISDGVRAEWRRNRAAMAVAFADLAASDERLD